MHKPVTPGEHALLARIIAAWPDAADRARALSAIGRAVGPTRQTGGTDNCAHNDFIRHVDGTIECGLCGRGWSQ